MLIPYIWDLWKRSNLSFPLKKSEKKVIPFNTSTFCGKEIWYWEVPEL